MPKGVRWDNSDQKLHEFIMVNLSHLKKIKFGIDMKYH